MVTLFHLSRMDQPREYRDERGSWNGAYDSASSYPHSLARHQYSQSGTQADHPRATLGRPLPLPLSKTAVLRPSSLALLRLLITPLCIRLGSLLLLISALPRHFKTDRRPSSTSSRIFRKACLRPICSSSSRTATGRRISKVRSINKVRLFNPPRLSNPALRPHSSPAHLNPSTPHHRKFRHQMQCVLLFLLSPRLKTDAQTSSQSRTASSRRGASSSSSRPSPPGLRSPPLPLRLRTRTYHEGTGPVLHRTARTAALLLHPPPHPFVLHPRRPTTPPRPRLFPPSRAAGLGLLLRLVLVPPLLQLVRPWTLAGGKTMRRRCRRLCSRYSPRRRGGSAVKRAGTMNECKLFCKLGKSCTLPRALLFGQSDRRPPLEATTLKS